MPPILQHTNDGSTGVRTLLGGEKGQMVLSANILGARPPVMPRQISWRKDGNNTPINNDSGKYIITTLSSQTNLTITNLRRMDDTGLYTVTAMHEAGSASLQFNLEVLSKLYFQSILCSFVPRPLHLKSWEGLGMRLFSNNLNSQLWFTLNYLSGLDLLKRGQTRSSKF